MTFVGRIVYLKLTGILIYISLTNLVFAENQAETKSDDSTILDEVTVTTTRSERGSKDVPAAVSIVGEEKIEKSRMFNISDALRGTPGVLMNSHNGAYDARLIIRGAGLKASYGVREITILRDGIPITDPDSFTRMDLIDPQDVERIEVSKGPGNLYAAGSSGGAVHVISKSVFDHENQKIKLGGGDFDTKNLHARFSGDITDHQAMAFTGSLRKTENDWRRHNEVKTNQFSLKHGLEFGGNNLLETELVHSQIDMQIPGRMDDVQWESFKDTGKQTDNNSAFKHSARDSKNTALNMRAEIDLDSATFKPKMYYNEFSHFHPVTGRINDKPGAQIFGTDLELEKPHKVNGKDASLTTGITWRRDSDKGEKKYQYSDVETTPDGRIIQTLSDRKGALSETKDGVNTLYGIFAAEHIELNKRWALDANVRIDRANIKIDSNELTSYDFRRGQYVEGEGELHLDNDFTLAAPSLGITYSINDELSVFTSLAHADQIPFASELDNNPNLDKSSVRNIELGLKGRSKRWSFDTSIYQAEGKDEVVKSLVDGETLFVNSGKTDKKGFEVTGSYNLSEALQIGLGYDYSDYTYAEFNELIRGQSVDRSGNHLPLIPKQKTHVFVDYKLGSGFSTRIQLDKKGSYYVDHANSEKYDDHPAVISMFIGYKLKHHKFSLNADNLSDERYALEVTKDSRGDKAYTAGSPRSIMASYEYIF